MTGPVAGNCWRMLLLASTPRPPPTLGVLAMRCMTTNLHMQPGSIRCSGRCCTSQSPVPIGDNGNGLATRSHSAAKSMCECSQSNANKQGKGISWVRPRDTSGTCMPLQLQRGMSFQGTGEGHHHGAAPQAGQQRACRPWPLVTHTAQPSRCLAALPRPRASLLPQARHATQQPLNALAALLADERGRGPWWRDPTAINRHP